MQDIKAYLSLVYGDNVNTIFDDYVYVWEELDKGEVIKGFSEYFGATNHNIQCKLPTSLGTIYKLNGKEVFNTDISKVVCIYSEVRLVGKLVLSREQIYKLYYTCLTHRNLTIRTYLINSQNEIEPCKVKSYWYSNRRPSLTLITSSERYMGKFTQNNELVSFTRN